MKPTSLASRVAWAQTLVSMAAMALVAVGTSVAVHAMLTWKTDQHLHAVLGRAAAYLEGASPETLDWDWLRHEVEEVRPHEMRIDVYDAADRPRIEAGPRLELPERAIDCASRAAVRACSLARGPFSLVAARDRSDDIAARDQLIVALLMACAIAGLLVVLCSRVVTERAVRPLAELAARVRAIEPGTGQRIGMVTRLVELDGLAQWFDDLVERFEEALSREKRFASEASHELRTPLTIARAEIESLARVNHDPDGLTRALAAVDRLGALVEGLLWFARAQGRLDQEQMDLVNLADVVRNEIAIAEKGRADAQFASDLPDEALVRGEETLIARAIANLLDNAIKHGDDQPIQITMTRDESRVLLQVVNGGLSIPPELREQIFVPFFRANSSPNTPGFGLGLPLARAVTRAHGGDIRLGSAPNDKTEMIVTLPLVEWA
jgi:signal transduction histidine kinase